MPKNKSKKTKLNSNNIYSEAFPPNKDGSRSNISQYSNIHDIIKDENELTKKINPVNIIYKPLRESHLDEIKKLHKEWFPIDYDNNYFKQIFTNKYGTYFTIGAFYTMGDTEIILGMALCEYREVGNYFINHTSREAIKEICNNIDFNEEASAYLKCQSYNCVYIMTIGVLDEYRQLHIGSNKIKKIYEIALCDNLCVGVYLDVAEYNKCAINFYEKIGFKNVARIKNYYDIKNNFYDSIVFLKIFTRKEKDDFRTKYFSFWRKLLNNLILMPINLIYKIIIFFLCCQCFRNKIKID